MVFNLKLTNSQYWKMKSLFRKPKLPRKMKKRIYGTRSMRKKFFKKNNINSEFNKFVFSVMENLSRHYNIPLNKLLKSNLQENTFPLKPIPKTPPYYGDIND